MTYVGEVYFDQYKKIRTRIKKKNYIMCVYLKNPRTVTERIK